MKYMKIIEYIYNYIYENVFWRFLKSKLVLADSHNSFLENAWFIFSCHGSLVCHTPRTSVQSKAHIYTIYTSSSIYLILICVSLAHDNSPNKHVQVQLREQLGSWCCPNPAWSETGINDRVCELGGPLVNWQNAVFKCLQSGSFRSFELQAVVENCTHVVDKVTLAAGRCWQAWSSSWIHVAAFTTC